jgi:hypothetical protein
LNTVYCLRIKYSINLKIHRIDFSPFSGVKCWSRIYYDWPLVPPILDSVQYVTLMQDHRATLMINLWASIKIFPVKTYFKKCVISTNQFVKYGSRQITIEHNFIKYLYGYMFRHYRVVIGLRQKKSVIHIITSRPIEILWYECRDTNCTKILPDLTGSFFFWLPTFWSSL